MAKPQLVSCTSRTLLTTISSLNNCLILAQDELETVLDLDAVRIKTLSNLVSNSYLSSWQPGTPRQAG